MDQHLLVFVTVAEKKNFSRAAEELHMTQPAVSQYIRVLEDNFGVRLLERTSKFVQLNKAGEIVYHHAKEINSLYTRMQNLVDDLTNHASGSLSIGASYTFGEYILPHIIAEVKSKYPEIEPEVQIGNTAKIANSVLRHQLDIGIVEGHFLKEKQLNTEAFAEDYMVIVGNGTHTLSKQNKPVSAHDLARQTWILREEGSGTREATEKLFKQFGINPEHIMYFGSTQPIKEAIKAGLGISLLSKWAIQKELEYGDLKEIHAEGLPFCRQFSILTTSPFQTKALQVFIELLRHNKELTVFKEK